MKCDLCEGAGVIEIVEFVHVMYWRFALRLVAITKTIPCDRLGCRAPASASTSG
jgi:hypothetical protein